MNGQVLFQFIQEHLLRVKSKLIYFCNCGMPEYSLHIFLPSSQTNKSTLKHIFTIFDNKKKKQNNKQTKNNRSLLNGDTSNFHCL